MKKFLLSLVLFPAVAYSQGDTTCVTIKGSISNSLYTQATISTMGDYSADATEDEIVSEAWTCNANGFPICNFRALLKYDLSSTIPAGAYITSAKLYLYAKSNALNGDHINPTYGTANESVLQRITQPWSPAGVGWLNQPATTTSGEATLPQSTSSHQDYVVNITNLVKYWAAHPEKNYGMLMRMSAEKYYNSMIFNSGQAAESLQPTLVICYTFTSPPPPVDTCLTIRGSVANPAFKQILLANYQNYTPADTTQTEMVSEAWTCNSEGIPVCNFRTLFKYDLTSIPSNTIISSAKLFLYAKANASNGDHINPTYGTANASLLQKVTQPWGTVGTGWLNEPNATTENQKILPQSTNNAENYVVNVTDFVQDWIAHPEANYGALLRLQTENHYNSMIFNSGQAASNLQPKLVICYTKNVLASLINDFQSSTTGNNVDLSWKIENGISLTNITVERSDNGLTFSRIGNVQPVTAAGEVKYDFVDNLFGRTAQQEYYRLAVQDKDGSSIYSNILLVKLNSDNAALTILPNPVKSRLQLSINVAKPGKADVTIINAVGQTVGKTSYQLIDGRNAVLLGNIGNLASGMYLVRVAVNGQVLSQRFIKE